MTDILQRVENMLIDCAIGTMRTLKTDDLTRVLYDASEEIVHLREKVAKITAQREDWIASCDILLTQLDWVRGAAGFSLEGEDSGLVEVIRAALEGKDKK